MKAKIYIISFVSILFVGCYATNESIGPKGENGESCSVVYNANGTATLTCPDGTMVEIPVETHRDSGQNTERGFLPPPCTNYEEVEVILSNRVHISDMESMEQLDGKKCVPGDLEISGRDISTLERLMNIETIGGSLKIFQNPNLTSFTLPSMTTILGDFWVYENPVLSGFYVPLLANVATNVYTPHEYPPSGLTIADNDYLTSFFLPSLAIVLNGDINISNNDRLASFAFPSLFSTGSLAIMNNSALMYISLESVQGVDWLDIRWNGTLKEIVMTNLVATRYGFEMSNNSSLYRSSFPRLNHVEQYFRIVDNPCLPNCLAQSLREQVEIIDAVDVIVARNDDPCIPSPCMSGYCVQNCEKNEFYTCASEAPADGGSDSSQADAGVVDSRQGIDGPVMVDSALND